MTDLQTYPPSAEHLTCAETARLLRGELKRQFPGVKFSVRSKTYSGGASIDIRYTDGPKSDAVNRIAQRYAGADFDGMIDLKTYSDHWLEPDGTATIAHAQGTEGSRGYLPEVIGDPPSPNARLVSFGADYVFVQREISPEWREEILQHFEELLGSPLTRDQRDHWRVEVPLSVDRQDGTLYRMVEHEREPLAQLVERYASHRER